MIRILVIENNDADHFAVDKALAPYGNKFELSHVSSLQAGIDEIKKNGCDLILSDLHLSDSNGVSTILDLKRVSDAPIVVLTCVDEDECISDAIRSGAFNYLHKSEMNGNLRRAILAAKANHDLRAEKKDKIMEMLRFYFPDTSSVKHC